ncbi:hypothetical protein [Halostagnicola larsenii]|uniref:hypothetical protein n=1 Tax=Halostagnicola larsenii TaxID=353800 RepID=UPI0012F7FD46|nr:hypothetical protein [Halostagnicola larsenii]
MSSEVSTTEFYRGIAVLAIPLAMLLLVQTASLYTLNQQANVNNSSVIFPALITGLVILFSSLFYLVRGLISDNKGYK